MSEMFCWETGGGHFKARDGSWEPAVMGPWGEPLGLLDGRAQAAAWKQLSLDPATAPSPRLYGEGPSSPISQDRKLRLRDAWPSPGEGPVGRPGSSLCCGSFSTKEA